MDINDVDRKTVSEVMSALARTNIEKRVPTLRENIGVYNERVKREGVSEETKAKLREAQARRRQREQAEKAALENAS